jgi:nucleotide-binding universal stress UspA family protein
MKSILVPTDFSAASYPALEVAIHLSEKTGAKLIVFHTSFFSETTGKRGLTYDEAFKGAMTHSKKKLLELVENLYTKNKYPVSKSNPEFLVHFGPSPSDDIIAAAVKKKVSLVVMGTHGASGLKKIFFGSNAAHVISVAKFPVLAIPANYKLTEFETVYYATDLSAPLKEYNDIKTFFSNVNLAREMIHIDYGWAKSPTEEKMLHTIQKKKIPFQQIHAKMEVEFTDVLLDFMRDKKKAILCVFHEKKRGIAAFLFGSKAKGLSMKMNYPLLVFPK